MATQDMVVTTPNATLRDVRCPACGHLQLRYSGGDVYIERKCRCGQMLIINNTELIAKAQ